MQLFRPSRLPPAADIERHTHRTPYATLVLAGSYEEAGDAGRFTARAGDVVLHGAFSAHRDRVGPSAAMVLDLPLAFDARAWPARMRVDDPDAIVRLAERDPAEAVTDLIAALEPAGATAEEELPDQLAAVLRGGGEVGIGAWAAACGRSREHVSRRFEALYGVSPAAYRADCRAKRAWRAIVASGDGLAGVAADTGYADQAHMTRAVTRLTGMAPHRWRMAMRAQAGGG
ncbi:MULTISPECIES: helix-turn-helix domain-containing protein [unclassified Sphingopyxis]|uniref:helix-turn-helix domain-containing protein n=1 Tax=unclassified Sphingopyxis TaxID=2614943 RepID=UPI0007372DCD|nr:MULTISPECIES: AraC family transcriptional regulator [unclassified Sphingopyxis]KTE38054.1 hypothetical protein ATE62_11950 [Sphingopyxis sp. HIX]KTE84636.1 hypothetical protein ATE72_07800 [Sphingopyxis sp. HXXIV]